jgi:hypothetical protein
VRGPQRKADVMTDSRGLDRIRLAESAASAALVLGLSTLPTAWPMLNGPIAGALVALLIVLTAAIYALHAVTFDCLRLTRTRISITHRKD